MPENRFSRWLRTLFGPDENPTTQPASLRPATSILPMPAVPPPVLPVEVKTDPEWYATPPPAPLPEQHYERLHVPPEPDKNHFDWLKEGGEEWSIEHYVGSAHVPDFSIQINGNAVLIRRAAHPSPWT